MVVYCILTGLAVYYIVLWLWYRHTDSRTSPGRADDAPLPQNEISGYTLIGESRYKGGQIGTPQDKSGHLPQAAGNDTILRRKLTDSRKKTFREQHPKRKKRPVTRMTNPTTRTRK